MPCGGRCAQKSWLSTVEFIRTLRINFERLPLTQSDLILATWANDKIDPGFINKNTNRLAMKHATNVHNILTQQR